MVPDRDGRPGVGRRILAAGGPSAIAAPTPEECGTETGERLLVAEMATIDCVDDPVGAEAR